jgi:hypothetical protein
MESLGKKIGRSSCFIRSLLLTLIFQIKTKVFCLVPFEVASEILGNKVQRTV